MDHPAAVLILSLDRLIKKKFLQRLQERQNELGVTDEKIARLEEYIRKHNNQLIENLYLSIEQVKTANKKIQIITKLYGLKDYHPRQGKYAKAGRKFVSIQHFMDNELKFKTGEYSSLSSYFYGKLNKYIGESSGLNRKQLPRIKPDKLVALFKVVFSNEQVRSWQAFKEQPEAVLEMDQIQEELLRIEEILTEEMYSAGTEKDRNTLRADKYNDDKLASCNLEIPEELRISLQQYILYFKTYLQKAKNVEIYFEVLKTDSGLRLDFKEEEVKNLEFINSWFQEYLDFIRKKEESIAVNFEVAVSEGNANILMAEIKNRVRYLEGQIEILSIKNNFLAKEVMQLDNRNQFLQQLSLNLSTLKKRESKNLPETHSVKFKRTLKQLLRKNQLENVIEELIKYFQIQKDDQKYDEVILQNSKISRINLEVRKGIITKDLEEVERQKITNSILEIINTI